MAHGLVLGIEHLEMEEFDGIEGCELAKGAVYPSVAKQKVERHGGSWLLPVRKFSCVRFLISAATAFEGVGEGEKNPAEGNGAWNFF